MIEINIIKPLYTADGIINLKVNKKINKGDFLTLFGKSGSGKTTLLRILAGLETPQSGKIVVDKEIWFDSSKKINLPPQKRNVGFVFQDYALFPNYTVLENLLYVNKDINLANHLLNLTELNELKNRYPQTLSGGQKQRVSLCRAMMNRPKILLMDEPLSALDTNMRTKLQNEILTLHKEFETTTIMVSHDPSEIYRLANRVVVLNEGKIINDGLPKDVLLKTSGSAKFSFEGELLDILKVDVIHVAIISIGQQIVEVVIGNDEIKNLKVGDKIRVSTKAFTPVVSQ